MKKIFLYISFLSLVSLSSCEDVLDKDPYVFTNDKFWTSEANLRAYCQDYYSFFFAGYTQDYTLFGGFFSGDVYNDDYLIAISRETHYYFPIDNTKATGKWDDYYKYVRRSNVMLEKIPGMNIPAEAKRHWTAVGRFFRAMAYSKLVSEYGDVPYFDEALQAKDTEKLYKNSDPRLFVVEKIKEDFEYALDSVRVRDELLQLDRNVAGAFMSRWMLYHATWFKYHGTTVGSTSKVVDNATIKKFLEAAVKGADVVIKSGKYAIGNTYNQLFSSADLSTNPEVVFYREYVEKLFPNALMQYNAGETQSQGGATLNAVNSYLCADGLPIGQSPLYKGKDKPTAQAVFADRDPRLYQTFVDSLRITNSKIHKADALTGFACKKFLNEEWFANGSSFVIGRNSPADAPVMRYAEVLLNYVEAKYELGTVGGGVLTQADIDLTINKIRNRALVKWGDPVSNFKTMPPVTLSGNKMVVNGVEIEDPARDPSVDPVLWEIRRERRVELILEGLRNFDLNRWAKYEYLNTVTNGKPNDLLFGAWISKDDYPGISIYDPGIKDSKGVVLYNPNGDSTKEGYIYPYILEKFAARSFEKSELNSERYYLKAVPIAQILLYDQEGYKLSQNPGW